MTDALDFVLAGPFLRATSRKEICIWLATSQAVDSKDITVELWEPALYGLLVFDEPTSAGAHTTSIAADVTLESAPVALHLYVHVLRVKPTRALAPNKVYAYRVVLNPTIDSLGSAVRTVLSPPGTALDRLPRAASIARGKQFASFVLPETTSWWMIGVPAQSYLTLITAATDYATRVKPPSSPSTAFALPAAPTALTLFGNPFTMLSDRDLPEVVFNAIRALASSLGGVLNAVEPFTTLYAAAYLLACSPGLWARLIGAQVASALSNLTNAVTATATLMANVPTYWLGTGSVLQDFTDHALGQASSPVNTALSAVPAAGIATVFADWANVTATDVGAFDVLKALVGAQSKVIPSFVAAGPPAVGFVASGESLDDVLVPKSLPDRIAAAVSADSVLCAADGTTRDAPASAAFHDVTLTMSFTTGRPYIAESGEPFAASPPATFGTTGTGTLSGKILEVAAGLGSTDPSPPPTTDVAIVQETTDARYASLQRAGAQAVLSLRPVAIGESPYAVNLPVHGRIFLVTGTKDGMHLGNRFWTKSSKLPLANGDRVLSFLKDIEVNLYQEGQATPILKGKTDATGWVDRFAISAVPDGDYTLRIEGPRTFTHCGPDTPVTNATGAFEDRVWQATSFPLRMESGVIVSIDREPIPDKTFRLLVDPLWMHSARATRVSGRVVSMIILHRTDEGGKSAGDAAHDASNWQVLGAGGGRVGAHYVLARDGTLVKCADESESIGHAGRDSATSWQGTGALNARTIGVEIANDETWERYSEKQYSAIIRFLRRFRTTTRSDVTVTPVDIVGHSDIRLLTDSSGNVVPPSRLGGRNDPGLAFDWTRLERRSLGLRRVAQEAAALADEWPDPPPGMVTDRDNFNAEARVDRRRDGLTFTPAHALVAPTATWAAERQAILTGRFAGLYPTGTPTTTINAQLVTDLTDIGFLASGTTQVLSAALQAFRSHFLSGPRRTWFRTKIDPQPWSGDEPFIWSTEEERSASASTDEWKITVVWANEVAAYVRAARLRATSSHPTYDGENGWKDAHAAESNETDKTTLPMP